MLAVTWTDIADTVQRIATALRIDLALVAQKSVQLLIIWLVVLAGLRVVGLLANRIERTVDDGDPNTFTLREKRGQTIAQLLRSVGKIVVVVVGLLLTLNIFIEIGPLLAGAGILGLAVSFGAQSLVKDVIAGFFFLFENQFALGDVIEASGRTGVVERMTLRVVMLRDVEGTLHMIPNGEIKTVSNKSRGWSRAVMDFGVAYDDKLDDALAVLHDEAEQFSKDEEWSHFLSGKPAIEVWGVESLSENSVVIRAVARTEPGAQGGVAREFRRRVKNRFDKEGLDFPFPQRTVHVRAAPGGQKADAFATPALLPGEDATDDEGDAP